MKMTLSTFTGTFQPYEQSLDYYHGKDVVHRGCLLKTDPEYSWERINPKIRNKIRKAQQLTNVEIKRVKGTKEDIKQFRTIWFDSEDETLPESLEPNEIMYLAYLDGELAGGLILTPSTPTVLYMHNLGSNDAGKRQNLPALILWNAVEELKDSEWKYIDVGVSFRPTLYSFFKNWQADSYPIIFTPPFLRPDLRLTPFTGNDIAVYKQDAPKEAWETLKQYFGETFTILPRATYCIKAVLQHLDIAADENVAVYKTYNDNDYISGCVSKPIEQRCKMTRKIDTKTKAVLVIHEFGIPYEDVKKLKKECEAKGIPMIEDCAWSYGSKIDAETTIGQVGDYAIYSLPKVFPVQYGGILTGLHIDDATNWSEYRMLDYFKREVVVTQLHTMLPQIDEINKQRRENWQQLAKLFSQEGFETFELPEDVYPGAFIVRMDGFDAAYQRYETFGVETGRYYHEKAVFMPVHQGLNESQLDYIYAVFRGELNLCSNYRREEG